MDELKSPRRKVLDARAAVEIDPQAPPKPKRRTKVPRNAATYRAARRNKAKADQIKFPWNVAKTGRVKRSNRIARRLGLGGMK
jgi:hypothetical protein